MAVFNFIFMGKKNSLILIYILFAKSTLSQNTFNKFYDKIIDNISDVIIEHDGFIFPLNNLHFNLKAKQLAITKVNLSGDTLWTRIYGNDSNDYFITYSALKTFDGNYAFGSYYSDKQTASYFSILKTDTMGDSIWFKKYAPDTNYFYEGGFITQCSDSGFLIAGQKVDKAFTDGNACIMKLDKDGNYLWDQEYIAPNYDLAFSSIELPDKGFFVLGWTRSYGAGLKDIYLIKTDSVGNKLWHKTYGYADQDVATGITATKDGNYLISGGVKTSSYGNAYVIKIDTTGKILWTHKSQIPQETFAWWARELSDSTIIVGGQLERDQIFYISNGFLLKLDSIGKMVWYRDFPVGNENAWFRNVYPTADGGFIMPGSAVDGPSGNQDAWLVKVDSLGCDSNGCALYTALPPTPTFQLRKSELQAYPNPCGNFFTLQFAKPNYDTDTYMVTVTNSAGQLVHQQKMVNSTQPHPIFVQALPPGFYMVQVSMGDSVYNCKLVKR